MNIFFFTLFIKMGLLYQIKIMSLKKILVTFIGVSNQSKQCYLKVLKKQPNIRKTYIKPLFKNQNTYLKRILKGQNMYIYITPRHQLTLGVKQVFGSLSKQCPINKAAITPTTSIVGDWDLEQEHFIIKVALLYCFQLYIYLLSCLCWHPFRMNHLSFIIKITTC